MIRKDHNHKPQTNQWHREEEPHNNHETPGRQTKQSNQLSVSTLVRRCVATVHVGYYLALVKRLKMTNVE